MAGCVASAWLLLEAGSNILATNCEGKNPLHLAVASGNVGLVKKLVLPLRALCEIGDSQGATPLHYASVSRVEMIRAFLCEGVSFLVRDVEGDNPLHWACRESATENVSEICSEESYLKDVPNQYGETPFHLAYRYHEKEICSIFGLEKASPCATATHVTENLLFTPFTHTNKSSLFDKHTPSVSNIWGLNPQVSQRC
jgi:ankyrin repeat protein